MQLSFVSPPKKTRSRNFGEDGILAVSEVQLITHRCITSCIFFEESTRPANCVAKCHEVSGSRCTIRTSHRADLPVAQLKVYGKLGKSSKPSEEELVV